MMPEKFAAAVAALTLIAVVRVASTHRVFSATHDEPAHLACGYEWLSGSYKLDPSHPPLARVLSALPLWITASSRAAQQGDFISRANELLYRGGRYEKNLARARLGNLVLLIVAVVGVAVWSRRIFSDPVALMATALFTNLPPILGHAGLATTDLAIVAALPWAMVALEVFYREPTIRHGALLGLALAFGILAKFSFVVFFPLIALIVTAVQWPVRVSVRGLSVSAAVAFFAVWGGYRFQFEKATNVVDQHALYFFELLAPKPLDQLARWTADHVPLPAAALPIGVAMVRAHDLGDNISYLFGEIGRSWWHYFPVVLFYKTPIPLLILMAWGLVVIVRSRDRRALGVVLVAATILGLAMTSSINIGVRHVLPVYVPLCAMAGYAVVEIWRQARDAFSRTALGALLVWLVIGVGLDHPDYLAWFNEAARPDPSQIVVDSSLDWGQDGLRLARVVREMQIDRVKLIYSTSIRFREHGVNAERLTFGPQSGWIAIGEAPLRFFAAPEQYGWLERYRPMRRIGKSLRLYYIP